MKSDILVIGAGASGLMAAYAAAGHAVSCGSDMSVTVLEKMPRPARKLMITGKGRCNFTNVKDWNGFSPHIRSKSNFPRSAFQNLPPEKLRGFFESFGMHTVVERGDRAFPASYKASDVVDTLVRACHSVGVRIVTEAEVASVACRDGVFTVETSDGRTWTSMKLIMATGGLSYPSTGSSGDGYAWCRDLGHSVTSTFPSLTALVPKGYKDPSGVISDFKGHIDRSSPLSEMGRRLCGRQFKYVTATLYVDGCETASESGELSFTDGGMEGPVGFQLSRRAVKAMVNGSRVSVKLTVNPLSSGKLQEEMDFEIAGFVGYERAVITAGGVSSDEFVPKTMESRIVPGLYLCGELLDMDADTGGYNLQLAFSTGALAGLNAAKSLLAGING